MTALAWLLAAAGMSLVGTGLARRYAVREALLDIPNRRSSHDEPTPKGGGLAVVVVTLGGVAAALALGALPHRLGWAILGGGAAVAAVGWIDDHGHVSPGLRLAVHAAAAGWALYWLGGVPSVALGSLQLPLGGWGVLPGALVIVAVTNFYNFMDGIDGIAASEAVVVCLAILVLAPGWTAHPTLPAVLAGAALGFLAWNWEPARIFMGDVGSGFLGFALSVMAFHSAAEGGLPLVVTLGFLGVFLLDPTVTLFRRLLGRERWWTAHRKHAYQRAVRAGLSHRAVTTAAVALDAGFGLALLAGVERGRLVEAGFLVLAVFAGLYYALERASPMAVGEDA